MANDEFDKLSKEELIDYINDLKKQLNDEKYGLYFDRKKVPENVVKMCQSKIPVLIHEKDKDILNCGPDNILIEGDNYAVLTALNLIYPDGFADIIYIDPPYNTGTKVEEEGFKYNDNLVDNDDPYRHTKWLNFMEARLKLALNSLKDTGGILISIDEHEFAQLKLLCDSIFGENNFIECFVYDKKAAAKGVPPRNMVASVHEYILCYAKNKNNFSFVGIKRDESSWSNPDNDPKGLWRNTNIKSTVSDKRYSVTDPKTGNVFTDTWACSEETMQQYVKEGRVIFPANKNGQVRVKEYLNEMTNATIPIKTSLGVFDGQWNTEMLTDLFGGNKKFNNAKHLKLMKTILGAAVNGNAIIFDFFAGSGTTGQAVLELNKEDGGNRKFILCTNNENNIMTDVCYPRIKTAVTGKRQDGSIYSDGLPGSVRYFKTDFVEDSFLKEQAKYNLVEQCDGLLCILEDCFDKFDQGAAYNIYLNTKKNKSLSIFNDNFDDKLFTEMLNNISKANVEENVVYYFSLDSNVDTSIETKVFEKVPNAVVKPIPSKIYEIYKKIANASERIY